MEGREPHADDMKDCSHKQQKQQSFMQLVCTLCKGINNNMTTNTLFPLSDTHEKIKALLVS